MNDLGDQDFLKSNPCSWLLAALSYEFACFSNCFVCYFNVFACFSYGSEGAGRLIENFRGLKK